LLSFERTAVVEQWSNTIPARRPAEQTTQPITMLRVVSQRTSATGSVVLQRMLMLRGHSGTSPFHSSATALGRKGGSKILENPSRPPSKKQARKRANFILEQKAKRDPRKEKIRQHNLEYQVTHGRIGKSFNEINTV
jgi:hypothetical protein